MICLLQVLLLEELIAPHRLVLADDLPSLYAVARALTCGGYFASFPPLLEQASACTDAARERGWDDEGLVQLLLQERQAGEAAKESSQGGVEDHYCCGLDVEWRPRWTDCSKGHKLMSKHSRSRQTEQHPCSTLQVGIKNFVVIFDLFALITHPTSPPSDSSPPSLLTRAFEEVIGMLFASAHVLKLGFGLQHDLYRLACSYPHIQAFRSLRYFLDLQEYSIAAALPEDSTNSQSTAQMSTSGESESTTVQQKGLSSYCEHFLDKPLDKSMQTSDWSALALAHLPVCIIKLIVQAGSSSHLSLQLMLCFSS